MHRSYAAVVANRWPPIKDVPCPPLPDSFPMEKKVEQEVMMGPTRLPYTKCPLALKKMEGELQLQPDEAHREKLTKAENAARNAIMKFLNEYPRHFDRDYSESAEYPAENVFRGSKVLRTGSFAAGLDTRSSDVDLTIAVTKTKLSKIATLFAIKRSLEREVSTYTDARKTEDGRTVTIEEETFSRLYVVISIPVLQMTHTRTGVTIDVTIKGIDAVNNTQFLVWCKQIDPRFEPLCRAVKSWAHTIVIENSRKGRLNGFAVCLLLINFLQTGTRPAVLPTFSKAITQPFNSWRNLMLFSGDYEEMNVKMLLAKGSDPKKNTKSVIELFIDFIDYYSEFDFSRFYVSVQTGTAPSRDWSQNPFMRIEDPLKIPAYNCGHTVKRYYDYQQILNKFWKTSENISQNGRIYFWRKSEAFKRIEREAGKQDPERNIRFCNESPIIFSDSNQPDFDSLKEHCEHISKCACLQLKF